MSNKIDTSKLSVAMDDFSNIVFTINRATGENVYLVGGCVRDTVMGLKPKDYDLASAVTPEQIMDVVERLSTKTVKFCDNLRTEPTGIDHGTVSIIYHGVPFEHTTFRKDVATDGRRAVVEYANDMNEDSLRRDFTMNAIYYDIISDSIVDPHNGVADIKAKRLRWVGNAEERIREDYLRIMRYFRFAAKYDLFMHPDDVEAIRKNVSGLAAMDESGKCIVSIERIASELLQILNYYNPHVAETMERCGVFKAIGMPFSSTQYMQSFNSPDAAHRLFMAMGSQIRYGTCEYKDFRQLSRAFKFSGEFERELWRWHHSYLCFTDSNASIFTDNDKKASFVSFVHTHNLTDNVLWILRNGHFYKDHIHWRSCGLYELVSGMIDNPVPVNGSDLIERGFTQGTGLGLALMEIKIEWIKSNYSLTKDQLIDIVIPKFEKEA